MRAPRDSAFNPLLSLLACAAAGGLCAQLRVPLPWMIGPMLAMAACNAAGAGLRAPPPGRALGQVVIGTALGLYFTPQVARELAALWPLLLASGVLAIVIGALCGVALARLAGIDRPTAFFASVPGGATEMAMLAERHGARVDYVAFAQSLRILLVVIAIPFTLTFSGVHGADAYAPASQEVDARGLGTLFAITASVGALLHRARVVNPFMFGPLFASATLASLDAQFSAMPGVVSNTGQLLLGCALGARFERRSLATLPRLAGAVAATVALAMLLSTLVALGLSAAAQVSFPTLVLAMAPGGIAEMCITAKVLRLGVPLVTAAQVVRVVVLVSTTGLAYRAALALAYRFRS